MSFWKGSSSKKSAAQPPAPAVKPPSAAPASSKPGLLANASSQPPPTATPPLPTSTAPSPLGPPSSFASTSSLASPPASVPSSAPPAADASIQGTQYAPRDLFPLGVGDKGARNGRTVIMGTLRGLRDYKQVSIVLYSDRAAFKADYASLRTLQDVDAKADPIVPKVHGWTEMDGKWGIVMEAIEDVPATESVASLSYPDAEAMAMDTADAYVDLVALLGDKNLPLVAGKLDACYRRAKGRSVVFLSYDPLPNQEGVFDAAQRIAAGLAAPKESSAHAYCNGTCVRWGKNAASAEFIEYIAKLRAQGQMPGPDRNRK